MPPTIHVGICGAYSRLALRCYCGPSRPDRFKKIQQISCDDIRFSNNSLLHGTSDKRPFGLDLFEIDQPALDAIGARYKDCVTETEKPYAFRTAMEMGAAAIEALGHRAAVAREVQDKKMRAIDDFDRRLTAEEASTDSTAQAIAELGRLKASLGALSATMSTAMYDGFQTRIDSKRVAVESETQGREARRRQEEQVRAQQERGAETRSDQIRKDAFVDTFNGQLSEVERSTGDADRLIGSLDRLRGSLRDHAADVPSDVREGWVSRMAVKQAAMIAAVQDRNALREREDRDRQQSVQVAQNQPSGAVAPTPASPAHVTTPPVAATDRFEAGAPAARSADRVPPAIKPLRSPSNRKAPAVYQTDEKLFDAHPILGVFFAVYVLVAGLFVLPLVRKPVMVWYRSQRWYVRGKDPIEILFKQIGMRANVEFFAFMLACLVGALGGWLYVILRSRPDTTPEIRTAD